VLLTGPFMAQADATIVNVAVPSVHAGLGASGAVLQLVVGGYLIAVAMLLITGARLGQAYGYRRAFVAGVSVFTLASLACGLAPDPAVLVIARILQGAGAGLMFPQTMTGIQLHFTGQDRVRAIGRYALALSSGAVSGQILGGVLVSADVLAVAALLLVVPLTLGSSAGWPPWAWACLAASLPATAAFAAAENRVARTGRPPLLTMDLLRIPAVRWGLVTMAVATSTYYALMFTLAQYLQGGLGRSPVVSGLTLVPWVAAIGALYLAGTRGSGASAMVSAHAFAVTTGVLAGIALLAAAAAWRASAPAPSPITRAERAPVASFGPRSRVGS